MRSYLGLILLTVSVHFSFAEDCGCTHTISEALTIRATDYEYKPGDVFCITAGNYGFFRFIGFEGTKEKPLIFKNCGGKVVINDNTYAGIEFQHSKHIHLTGTGDDTIEYGIKVNYSATLGVSMNNFTTDVEVNNVELTGLGFAGIMAKTDPKCEAEEGYDNFVMENLRFHHNYIHNIHGEGFYVGYTGNYEEGKTDACPGKAVYGHDVKHVKIHDNILVDIGWDGIQVSLGTEDVEIFDNYIENPGKDRKYAQESGIQFGSGTVGKIYNNTIINGTRHGITNFGLGPVYIYNNLIVKPEERGIYNNHQKSVAPGNGYYIANNTIISPGEEGIFYDNGDYFLQSPFECYNNLIINSGKYTKIANYASHWSIADIHAYIGFNNEALWKTFDPFMQNNIFSRDVDFPKFLNPSKNNYFIGATSPAIDKGTNLVKEKFGFDYDLTGFKRKNNFDVGAFEAGNPLSTSTDMSFSKVISIYPNPVLEGERCVLELKEVNSGKYKISVLPLDGKKEIVLYNEVSINAENNQVDLGNSLPSGIYLVKVQGDSYFQIQKLLIK